jgi:hypothetical protein
MTGKQDVIPRVEELPTKRPLCETWARMSHPDPNGRAIDDDGPNPCRSAVCLAILAQGRDVQTIRSSDFVQFVFWPGVYNSATYQRRVEGGVSGPFQLDL